MIILLVVMYDAIEKGLFVDAEPGFTLCDSVQRYNYLEELRHSIA